MSYLYQASQTPLQLLYTIIPNGPTGPSGPTGTLPLTGTFNKIYVDSLTGNTGSFNSLIVQNNLTGNSSTFQNIIVLNSITGSNCSFNSSTNNKINVNSLTGNTGSFNSLLTPIINTTAYVDNSMSTAQINTILNNTNFNRVIFRTGTYTLTSFLNIARSNLVVEGNYSTLNLANSVNEPNVFIGDITSNPPTIPYSNVFFRNFTIDGNKNNQSSETSLTHNWIYNNCVGVNLMNKVLVDNCVLRNARSGGSTITVTSSDITFSNNQVYNNWFDGLTCYFSSDIFFTNNYCYGHTGGAGISIDDGNTNFIIANNNLINNQQGIFARWINDCSLTGNVISSNIQNGMFVSGYNSNPDNGLLRWNITGNTITQNGNDGLFLQSCKYFAITGNTISNNAQNGINITSYNTTPSNGVSSYNSISGNTISGNLNVGIYNDASNSFSNGSRNNILGVNTIHNNVSGQVVGDYTSFNIIDDTQVQTQLVTLTNGSNTTNLYGNPTGSSNFQFPPSGGVNGYVLTTDGSGNSSWTNTKPNFTIGQVITGDSTSGTSWHLTSLWQTIIPRYTTSFVKITISGVIAYSGSFSGSISIDRNGTDLSGGHGFAYCQNTESPFSISFIDQPATTSLLTYTLTIRVNTSGTTVFNNGACLSIMLVEEILN